MKAVVENKLKRIPTPTIRHSNAVNLVLLQPLHMFSFYEDALSQMTFSPCSPHWLLSDSLSKCYLQQLLNLYVRVKLIEVARKSKDAVLSARNLLPSANTDAFTPESRHRSGQSHTWKNCKALCTSCSALMFLFGWHKIKLPFVLILFSWALT